jgi:uncharacterized membrane protein YdjX (TVP38/TMEM64 family)
MRIMSSNDRPGLGDVRQPASRLAGILSTPGRIMAALFVVLAAPILLAFLLFEDPLLAWTRAALDGASPDAIAVLCALLLATDILLPVPSSIVATAAATALDPTRAFLAIAIGSTTSASLGWALGRCLRPALPGRIVDAQALDRADRLYARWGSWAFACTRAVPILAEEFAILAGVHRVPFWRVHLPLTLLASTPMAAFYVIAVRAAALATGDEPPFWFLVVVASTLPLLGLALAKWIGARASR